MSFFHPSTRPVVIAHRGASLHAPENTLAAFRLALEQGADGIELDAKLSADRQVVVMHDRSLRRTTGRDAPVGALTLAELKRLDAGAWFSPAFAGERVPTLDEVLETVAGQALVDIELTNYFTPRDGLPEVVAQAVERHAAQDWVLFTSFLPGPIDAIRRRLPGCRAGLLLWPGRLGWISRHFLVDLRSEQILLPNVLDISPEQIHRDHQRGRWVAAWVVNDPEVMRQLASAGIDAIITDHPALAVEQRRPA
jgi:glycerophosphoryl diester phosphodiesterase